MDVVRWKKGSRAKGSAPDCMAEIERIRARDGVIRPEVLAEEAKDKKNPMHDFIYDRNQKEAARAYYVTRSRLMLRSLEVVRKETPNVPTRVYETQVIESDEEDNARTVYQSVDEIMSDPLARDELLARAIREAVAFRRRYNALSELAKIFSAMDEFLINAEI